MVFKYNDSAYLHYVSINDTEKVKAFKDAMDDDLLLGVFLNDYYSPLDNAPMIAIYMCIFTIGLMFNGMACAVIACSKSMHTTTGCYLFNLAVSDMLLLTSGAPEEVYEIFHFSRASNGQIGCFLRCWAGETSAGVSTMIVTVFTIERYLAICRPFQAHMMSDVSRVIKLTIIIWVIVLLSSLPLSWQSRFVLYDTVNQDYSGSCYFDVRSIPYSIEISTVVFFIGPMTVISVLHAFIGINLLNATKARTQTNDRRTCVHQAVDSTHKTLKLLVAIVVIFFVCWAPVRVQRWLTVQYWYYWYNWNAEGSWSYSPLIFFSRILCLMSSIINPIVYSIMSRKFRDAFKDLYVKKECRKRYHTQNVNSIMTTKSDNKGSSYCKTTPTSVNI